MRIFEELDDIASHDEILQFLDANQFIAEGMKQDPGYNPMLSQNDYYAYMSQTMQFPNPQQLQMMQQFAQYPQNFNPNMQVDMYHQQDIILKSPDTPQNFQSNLNQYVPPQPVESFEAKSLYKLPVGLASQQMLTNIQESILKHKEDIENVFAMQKTLFQNPQQDAFNKLLQEQRRLKSQSETMMLSLQQLYKSIILEPPDLQRYFNSKRDLEIHFKQLDLLILELNSFATQQQNPPCLASLVIHRQPFPLITNKNKQLTDDQLQLQLLTGANTRIQSVSPVKATILCDITHGKERPIR
eukprot:TRINITY_DN4005_c0_g1_i1.p1 TRINITY_DN4005_c0_g1~~TRINITY_DN4005_c0_g1_i1.p1  ORF type:complete len:299 (-),score=70.51 TRINITY_DN4005_c0_g1_i1:890-1786(-)